MSSSSSSALRNYIDQQIPHNKMTQNFQFDEILERDEVFTVKGLPITLREDGRYLIIKWDTNWLVEAIGGNRFKVLDKKGEQGLHCATDYFMVYT